MISWQQCQEVTKGCAQSCVKNFNQERMLFQASLFFINFLLFNYKGFGIVDPPPEKGRVLNIK